MATRAVVVYGPCDRGDDLYAHHRFTLEDVARGLARVRGDRFAGWCEDPAVVAGPRYLVPTDTLLRAEADRLGIESADDLFGGVVPHAFARTKAIAHPLIGARAARPDGWSEAFAARIRSAVLPGFTAFSAADARAAAARLLERAPVRVKRPEAAGGRGQWTVKTLADLEHALAEVPADEMARAGLVLEMNLERVRTFSVGRVGVADLVVSYHGEQQTTIDNDGAEVYGGSALACVRGDWVSLGRTEMPPLVRDAVRQGRRYDRATALYPGLLASRRNYDVGCGADATGRSYCGVFEQSWRAGGASPAEVAALEAFREDPALRVVEVATVERYGRDAAAPPGTIVHFAGTDPTAGPLVRYTVVTGRRR